MTDTAPDRTDSEVVLQALIGERGGRAAFSVAQLAIARNLARILTSDTPSAASIDGLIALLPPMRTESLARAYDLQRLSGRQLRLLDWLLGVAAGAERVDSKLKPRNRSELEAEYLGFALGKLARSGCVPRWAPSGSGRLPTANEKIEISSLLDGLLWSVGIDGQELWRARAPKRAAPSQETLPSELASPVAAPSTEGAVIPIAGHGYGGGSARKFFGDNPRGGW
jgi:hypothetical protein